MNTFIRLAIGAAMAISLAGIGHAQPSARIAELFATLDTNGDDTLTMAEWTAAGRREQGFKRTDANEDGKVTRQELGRAVAQRMNGGGSSSPAKDDAPSAKKP